MINDYASLKAAVASWANRDDLTALIPDFIQLGEIGLYNTLRSRLNEKDNTGVLSSDSITIPGDYLEAILMTVNDVPLMRVSPQKMAFLKSTTAGELQPQYFTREQGKIIVFPYLGGATYRLLYWGSFIPLSDANPTHALLVSNPDLYLWFALLELAVYLDDEKGGARWSAQAKRAVDGLNQSWLDETISGSSQQVNEVGGDYGT